MDKKNPQKDEVNYSKGKVWAFVLCAVMCFVIIEAIGMLCSTRAVAFQGMAEIFKFFAIPIMLVSTIVTVIYTKIKIKSRLVRYVLCLLIGLILGAILLYILAMIFMFIFANSR